jgi:pimeloyl-ACP methyl ester carboxylesterase
LRAAFSCRLRHAGLAATLAVLGQIQDALTAQGFVVVTYDRIGVGFSDATTVVQTVDDCVADMHEVVLHASDDPSQTWIFVGPSMGSVVCQAYFARYPERCAGFMNLDGFAHPFYLKRDKFMSASKMYAVMSFMAKAGIMRCGDAMSVGVYCWWIHPRSCWLAGCRCYLPADCSTGSPAPCFRLL